MKRIIKKEFIGTYCICPLTKKKVILGELCPSLYEYYFANGYEFVFEKEVTGPPSDIMSEKYSIEE
jgi:hypothetical protein